MEIAPVGIGRNAVAMIVMMAGAVMVALFVTLGMLRVNTCRALSLDEAVYDRLHDESVGPGYIISGGRS